MVIEMLMNSDILKNDFTFSKGNNYNYVHYWKNF
jgi:hypothetical protein